MKHALLGAIFVLFATVATSQQAAQKHNPAPRSSQKADAHEWATAMQKVYMDESHCLTSPEIRSNKDNPISCYCRDAIVDARYVYFTYLLPFEDRNLDGAFLSLQRYAGEQCSRDTAEAMEADFIDNIDHATTSKDWKWTGPEVVRTYPPDDVIKRIKPSGEHGSGRWVPFTVQLIYRDAQGRVMRTEEYSSREFIPVFPEKP